MQPYDSTQPDGIWTGAVIQWPAGGAVLPAAYMPACYFSWDYMVNVVKVQMTESTITCAQNNIPTQRANGIVYFQNNATVPTMATTATVTLTGATAWDGSIRGVKYIDLGFIQFITPTVWTYSNRSTAFNAASHTKPNPLFAGNAYLDRLHQGQASPWADAGNETGVAYAGGEDEDEQLADENQTLQMSISDTPYLRLAGNDGVSSQIALSFALYLAVHSWDADSPLYNSLAYRPNGASATNPNNWQYFNQYRYWQVGTASVGS